jgi:hypothetical protein
MNQDIIEMAREAGFKGHQLEYTDWYLKALENLVKLVAAKERERIKEEQQRCYVARGEA